jgi:hypothetical protein
MLIGYAHVWIADQNLALQRRALTDAGCAKSLHRACLRRRGRLPSSPRRARGRHGRCRKLDRLARSVRRLIEAVDA